MIALALPLTTVFVGSPIVYIAAASRVRAIKSRERRERRDAAARRNAERWARSMRRDRD